MTLACDSEAGLKVDDSWIQAYDKLVEESGALFGARHYKSYRFLVALTDQFGHNAIEHHESSDNRVPERLYLDEIQRKLSGASLLPHEFVHSWNGKFRRPEGLVRSNFQDPLKTRMLWIYEGLTEYYGFVLSVRSGLWTKANGLENWGEIADWAINQKGRDWRSLEDTAAANHLYSSRGEWSRRRRGVDFYDEGALMWLDADTLIREKTKGARSLDDFCKNFHGGGNGAPQVKAYTFEDVVKSLNDVIEHDWKGFLNRRLSAVGDQAPLEGIIRGGWKLTMSREPSDLRKASDDSAKTMSLTTSIGLSLSQEGTVLDVVPGSASDKAGIGPHMKILAVNGRRFDGERLIEAIHATEGGKAKLELLIENGDFIKTHPLDYAGGSKHPRLVRDESKTDWLGKILAPRTGN